MQFVRRGAAAEARLGVELPDSYRSFLLVSDDADAGLLERISAGTPEGDDLMDRGDPRVEDELRRLAAGGGRFAEAFERHLRARHELHRW